MYRIEIPVPLEQHLSLLLAHLRIIQFPVRAGNHQGNIMQSALDAEPQKELATSIA